MNLGAAFFYKHGIIPQVVKVDQTGQRVNHVKIGKEAVRLFPPKVGKAKLAKHLAYQDPELKALLDRGDVELLGHTEDGRGAHHLDEEPTKVMELARQGTGQYLIGPASQLACVPGEDFQRDVPIYRPAPSQGHQGLHQPSPFRAEAIQHLVKQDPDSMGLFVGHNLPPSDVNKVQKARDVYLAQHQKIALDRLPACLAEPPTVPLLQNLNSQFAEDNLNSMEPVEEELEEAGGDEQDPPAGLVHQQDGGGGG